MATQKQTRGDIDHTSLENENEQMEKYLSTGSLETSHSMKRQEVEGRLGRIDIGLKTELVIGRKRLVKLCSLTDPFLKMSKT